MEENNFFGAKSVVKVPNVLPSSQEQVMQLKAFGDSKQEYTFTFALNAPLEEAYNACLSLAKKVEVIFQGVRKSQEDAAKAKAEVEAKQVEAKKKQEESALRRNEDVKKK